MLTILGGSSLMVSPAGTALAGLFSTIVFRSCRWVPDRSDESRRRAKASDRDTERRFCLPAPHPAATGAGVLCVGAWGGRRHDAFVHGGDCRWPWRTRRRDAALSVSLYGKSQQAARSA